MFVILKCQWNEKVTKKNPAVHFESLNVQRD